MVDFVKEKEKNGQFITAFYEDDTENKSVEIKNQKTGESIVLNKADVHMVRSVAEELWNELEPSYGDTDE